MINHCRRGINNSEYELSTHTSATNKGVDKKYPTAPSKWSNIVHSRLYIWVLQLIFFVHGLYARWFISTCRLKSYTILAFYRIGRKHRTLCRINFAKLALYIFQRDLTSVNLAQWRKHCSLAVKIQGSNTSTGKYLHFYCILMETYTGKSLWKRQMYL